MTKKSLCVKDGRRKYNWNDEGKIQIITEYFKKMLAPEEAETNKKYKQR